MSDPNLQPHTHSPAPRPNTPRVEVTFGDITALPSDVLVTSVTTDGNWEGGVDKAIRRRAGLGFHALLAQQCRVHPIKEGDVVIVPAALGAGEPVYGSHGDLNAYEAATPFGAVAFTADNLTRPLSQVILNGLTEIDTRQFEHAAIPLMRTGNMQGKHEDPMEAVRQLGLGVGEFVRSNPQHLQHISIVAYPNSYPAELHGPLLALQQ